MSDDLDRRSFIERLAALAAVADLGRQPLAATEPGGSRAAPAGTFNGIQMGPHTILDEGIERTLDLIADTAAIYTGVGFDVPGSPDDDPETIYQATLKSFEAGAHGIVISREYEEMQIEHLKAVGRAYRQVKKG